MLRRLHAFLVLGVANAAVPAAAQEPSDEPTPEDSPLTDGDTSLGVEEPALEPEPEASESVDANDPPEPTDEGANAPTTSVAAKVSSPIPAANEPESTGEAKASEAKASEKPEGFQSFVTGYFRAPLAMGFSQRPTPDNPDGPSKPQVSYGPNRTVDASYYSFAYTRLQEQDWAEVFIGARKEHVEAAIGLMGYWYQSVGFRNNDAAWSPGLAYLTLDTDFEIGGITPNIAVTGGAWWPKFGTFDKYDTYTLGRFRQLGEQVRLTVPFSSDLELTVVQGFGSARDGSSNILAPPPYQATVGLMLLHYEHLSVSFKDFFDIGIHYNSQWTRDPNLFQTTVRGKAFTDAAQAYVTTMGGEATLGAPYVGRLWVSPSLIRVKNGWALAEAGIEVMHSLGGDGLATNYLGWSGSLSDSTGSGELISLGFLYENTLSNITGQEAIGTPEVTLNIFGLFADTTLDLPVGSSIPQDRIGQFKYGADVELQALDWLGLMLRWDEVNYNLDHGGFVFSAITPRVTFSSHYLSGERFYIQYSRYRYGDEMVLAGQWPWGTPLVAGSDIIQGGAYSGKKPDMDVVKLQAEVSF